MKHSRLLRLGTALVVALLAAAPLAYAQQLSLFTQYRENATLINPAAMESDFLSFGYNMTVGGTVRRQWTGVQDPPQTQVVRFNWINSDSRGAALHAGGYLINDETGPTGFTGIYGRVGTVISRDPEDSGLSVGLSAGYVGYRVKLSELVVADGGDPIAGNDQSQSHPDVGFGVYYYKYANRDNLFYGGVSMPQLLGFDVTFQDENGMFSVERVRHYYGQAGWYLFTGEDSFLELSSWVKYVEGSPLNADISLRYQLPAAPFIGIGFSTAKTFHFEAGVNVGQSYGGDANFRLGYAYDYSFSSFGPSLGGTHELQVSVALDR